MEDAFVADSVGPDALFGVFDGHYGKRAAQYSADNLSKVVDGTHGPRSGQTDPHFALSSYFTASDTH